MNEANDKKAIRQDMRRRRAEILRMLSGEEACDLSCKIARNVLFWDVYERAQGVMIYHPIEGEPNLLSLIAKSPEKRFYLPRVRGRAMEAVRFCSGDMLVRSGFGILEPQGKAAAAGEIELIIAPAIACDGRGIRIGYGGGYFDRFLAGRPESTGFAVAAYDFQVLCGLPREAHDIAADYIITQSGVRACVKG